MLKRTEIRYELATRLKLVSELTGIDVHSNYVYAVTSLPAIRLKTPLDEVNLSESSTTTEAHELEMVVNIVVQSIDAVDVLLDNYCEIIEQFIKNNRDIGGTCQYAILEKTEMEFENTETPDRPMASADMTFKIFYTTPV